MQKRLRVSTVPVQTCLHNHTWLICHYYDLFLDRLLNSVLHQNNLNIIEVKNMQSEVKAWLDRVGYLKDAEQLEAQCVKLIKSGYACFSIFAMQLLQQNFLLFLIVNNDQRESGIGGRAAAARERAHRCEVCI